MLLCSLISMFPNNKRSFAVIVYFINFSCWLPTIVEEDLVLSHHYPFPLLAVYPLCHVVRSIFTVCILHLDKYYSQLSIVVYYNYVFFLNFFFYLLFIIALHWLYYFQKSLKTFSTGWTISSHVLRAPSCLFVCLLVEPPFLKTCFLLSGMIVL